MRGPTPTATYRFQLTPTFGFDRAAAQLDRLQRLGVSHVYLSPVTEAVPGSTHGYDVVDHARVREELGGVDGLSALLDACAGRGMGVVIDHVPNHTAVGQPELNGRWWAMLRDGPASVAARWFDVDWAAADGKVILPVLGEPLVDVVGRLTVVGDELRLGEQRWPLTPGTEGLAPADALRTPALRAAVVAGSGPQRPALLHDRRAGRRARRGPRRGRRRRHGAARHRRPSRLRRCPRRPRRRAGRPAHVPGGVARRHRRPLAARREDPRARRDAAPVVARRGHDRVRARHRRRARPPRSRRVGGAARAVGGDHRRRSAVPDVGAGGPAGGPRIGAAPRPRARRPGCPAATSPRSPSSPSTSSATARTCPTTRVVRRWRRRSPRRARRARTSPPRSRSWRPPSTSRASGRTRWQQLTGPATAKGVEDRAFWRYVPLASLGEVGGRAEPDLAADPLAAVHGHHAPRGGRVADDPARRHDPRHGAGGGRAGDRARPRHPAR